MWGLNCLDRPGRFDTIENFWNFEKYPTLEDSFPYFDGQNEYNVKVSAHWN